MNTVRQGPKAAGSLARTLDPTTTSSAAHLATVSPAPTTLQRFQVMSDLHLEIDTDIENQYEKFQVPKAEATHNLILAGDIGLLSQYSDYRNFLARQCKAFARIFMVLGNHDFYDLSHQGAFEQVKKLKEDPKLRNLHVLNQDRFDVDKEVTILGCTLWSHIPPGEGIADRIFKASSDFRRIKDWGVDAHNKQHKSDLAWLKGQIKTVHEEDPNRRVLVVTHYAPSRTGTSHPEHEHPTNPFSHAFSSDVISRDMQPWEGMENVNAWVFGHTHWNASFNVGNIGLFANQRGYVYSKPPKLSARAMKAEKGPEFDAEKCIEV